MLKVKTFGMEIFQSNSDMSTPSILLPFLKQK